MEQVRIAVLIPCYNEAETVAKVVRDFKKALPEATVYVYDNNSQDDTAERAHEAGALVFREKRQGKGNVVRRMFADIEADVYILCDGDGTYDAKQAPRMVERLMRDRLDMLCGARCGDSKAFRLGHRFGNYLFNLLVDVFFEHQFRDILTGYRVLSRRFVKSFPSFSSKFEVEMEMTIHALELRMPVSEIEVPYFPRPQGSESKLKTFRDGVRILTTLIILLKETRPFFFFSLIASIFATISLVLFWPVWVTYLKTGSVPRFPTAFLSMGIMILAFISMTCGNEKRD